WHGPGAELQSPSLSLHVRAASTAEFGDLERVEIIAGDLRTRTENVLFSGHESLPAQKIEFTAEFNALPESGYLRSEVSTRKESRIYRAYTNPIWLRSARSSVS
ncbi:hypothetical protein L0128_18735, partial [candidate division KSB1 bacterium]|nr:hypothetical protein [candidate division KSB1 bacterium]